MNVSLYLLCSLMVPVWSCSAPHLRPRNADWILTEKGGMGQNMQPCNALMSCHTIRFRQIINLDNLSCHDIIGRFFCVPLCGLTSCHAHAPLLMTSACLLAAGTRRQRRGKRGREEECLWWRSEIRQADVDTSGRACPLGNLILFINSLVRLEKPLRSHTVHQHLISLFFLSLPICLSSSKGNLRQC